MGVKVNTVRGLLGEIEASHDFDRIVARKVFIGDFDRARMNAWFEQEKAQRIAADQAEDSSFDGYDYALRSTEVLVESGLSEIG